MRRNGKSSPASRKNGNGQSEFDTALLDGGAVDRAGRKAVRAALREHKLLGHRIVVWRKGKIVWLKPEEI